ncbi:hypothetical protein CYMTET_3802, partial [Cymbomonas tetramitiformis]
MSYSMEVEENTGMISGRHVRGSLSKLQYGLIAMNVVLSMALLFLGVAFARMDSNTQSETSLVNSDSSNCLLSDAQVYGAAKDEDVCNGHGTRYFYKAYNAESESAWCECFDCWGGRECDTPNEVCVAAATSGDPLLFEEYWTNASLGEGSVLLSHAHKIGYQMPWLATDPSTALDSLLKDNILELHKLAGNVDTAGAHVVLGVGSTQLVAAAMYALSKRTTNYSSPALVWAAKPYYGSYKAQADYFRSELFRWTEDKPQVTSLQQVIEFVTAPNNPDGSLRSSQVEGADVVTDAAYYWPHFIPIARTLQPEAHHPLLFTLSKITGHAGSRLGWAIVKDAEVAKLMTEHVSTTTFHVSRDTQARALALLTHITSTQ